MSKTIGLYVVDPAFQTITRRVARRNPHKMGELLGSKDPIMQRAIGMEGVELAVVVDRARHDSQSGGAFRFRGGATFYGKALIVGLLDKRAVSCPFDEAHLHRAIAWGEAPQLTEISPQGDE